MTGTAIDRYTPIYMAFTQRFSPAEVDRIDLSVLAAMLGIGAPATGSPEAWDAQAQDVTRQRMAAAARGEQATWDDIDL